MESGPIGMNRDALARLAATIPEHRLEQEVVEILSRFGPLKSISKLLPAGDRARKERIFFVDFHETRDAMSAASGLDCVLFGFSTVVVRIPVWTDATDARK